MASVLTAVAAGSESVGGEGGPEGAGVRPTTRKLSKSFSASAIGPAVAPAAPSARKPSQNQQPVRFLGRLASTLEFGKIKNQFTSRTRAVLLQNWVAPGQWKLVQFGIKFDFQATPQLGLFLTTFLVEFLLNCGIRGRW